MKKAVNYIRGSVRVFVECPYPERLVNVCAQNDIEFWDLERVSPTVVHITMHIHGYRRLGALAEKAGFEIRQVQKTGVPFFLWKLRKRYVLLAGMLLMFLTVWGLSMFVWEIDVQGNETVSSQEILASLKELGVGIGSFGPTISSEAISNDMLLKIPELSWIAVNVRGSHADVLVRERLPKPDILDEKAPTMVYATKSGIITKMSVLEGARVCAEGSTVQAGDILVTGVMDSLSSGKRTVHAMAEVYARTWYELSAQMPLETTAKTYTGEKKTKTAVILAGKRINFYFNGGISFAHYDKMTTENTLKLPTGNILPVTIVKEKYSEYTTSGARLAILKADQILQKDLLDRLQLRIGDGSVTTTAFETSEENGVLKVTLKAECLEQIAAERPFTAEELQQALQPIQEKTKETGN
ncbi:similar to stage IV sporulation protein [Sporobacter termitidis DSM 10068]|uniref:Similar to stage IV sporulation protein n=1 Tax=Sporobacter termitidis DSM 10068 TaxID=1123282 RepID=A0A1M5WYG3_9FIRM|nr:sporulation protein YqfD [Sporobacter termitidis]SHH92551.1 similar to stage IV sporulation protein [Sporobacter termitidis DSM 10068]